MQQPGVPGMQPSVPGTQPPFIPPASFPGMPTGFAPNMVPPGMGGYPGAMPTGPLGGATSQADNSVVAHKLPSSQVGYWASRYLLEKGKLD
ncbi:hypothetical protein DPMN_169311 [Dreissena polymorpha]|uniref:Uncharacterized protein n=1 Tax=Dreissena polymorpha TaxID=45954 RepID=A0A9D4F745_DREPO|nr:hypothetical protein DPMN_169311 [Dreissena polymorpha]